MSNVLARGAAFGAGLQVQDRIVAVDGISFRNVTHGFAVETIKNAIPNRVRRVGCNLVFKVVQRVWIRFAVHPFDG